MTHPAGKLAGFFVTQLWAFFAKCTPFELSATGKVSSGFLAWLPADGRARALLLLPRGAAIFGQAPAIRSWLRRGNPRRRKLSIAALFRGSRWRVQAGTLSSPN